MSADNKSYDGDIQWNDIYRQHYSLNEIDQRLRDYVEQPSNIVIAGFAEIANRLAKKHQVHFVEFSESMVEAAKNNFSAIHALTHGDIVKSLADTDEPIVFVICRVSAYWQSLDSLAQFFKNASRVHRQCIVVDFFDANRLESTPVLGDIVFSNVREEGDRSTHVNSTRVPRILLADVQGRYNTSNGSYHFSETRAFYYADEVADYARKMLPEHSITIESPLVSADPGFTLVVTKIPS